MAPRVDLPGPLGVIDIPPGWRKPCSVNHWGEGVLVAATPAIEHPDAPFPWRFYEIPNGVVGDGRGGAFVLSTSTEFWSVFTQGLFTVRHVDSTGAAGPVVRLTDPISWVGAIGPWSEAAIVSSPKHRAIVAAFDHEHAMTAQRYDEAGAALWQPKKGVRLSSGFALSHFNVVNLSGEEDGDGGAIFAWREARAAGAVDVRAQRVARDGRVRWGASAPRIASIAGIAGPPPQPWLQLVATGKGGAIVVAPETSGAAFRYVATPIDAGGRVGTPTTLVASTTDDWRAAHRLRLAVPDGAGGLFLGYAGTAGAIHLLRYSPSSGVRWDIATGMPIDPSRLALHEDGRGGVLVGGLGGAPTALRMRRYDANGAVTFDIDTVGAPMIVQPVQGNFFARDWESRSVIPLPDGKGGAIVAVHEVLQPRGPFAVVTRCYDAQGQLVSAGRPLTSHELGQTLPRAAVAGAGRAIVAYTQYENHGASGYDVSAQRVGCCMPPGDPPPPPPFGCEIVLLPDADPSRSTFRLPCGNRERGFGVIPLSRFVTALPGLRAPGGLATHDAPAPAWVRLVFRGNIEGIAISLATLGGKRAADAKPFRAGSGVLTLTFKPPKEADLLLVVSHEGATARDAVWSFDVMIEHGNGRAPALPRGGPKPSNRRSVKRVASRAKRR